MKSFFTVFVCLLAVDSSMGIDKKTIKLPPETTGVVLQAVQQCMPESGVSIEALLQVYQGGYSEDKKFKDFIYCCYRNTGYLNPDGRMNIEKIVKLFKNEPEIEEGLRRCGEAPGRNAKEVVFNFFKCFQDTVPVRFSL